MSNVEGVEFFGIRPSRMMGHFAVVSGDGKAIEREVVERIKRINEVLKNLIFALYIFVEVLINDFNTTLEKREPHTIYSFDIYMRIAFRLP